MASQVQSRLFSALAKNKKQGDSMPLYRLDKRNGHLEKVDRSEFSSEAELQSLVERNLDVLLGIRLIATEYPIPNGRIDSLGLDEDGIPVIIEYKWKKDLSAILQGLFYLDWVMQNRRPFESIVKDKLGKDVHVNWSKQPRLLIIAQDFDVKELAAINQMAPSIELIKYSLYDGLFSIEGVNIVESKASSISTGEPRKEVTVAELAARANEHVQQIFYDLREQILGLSDSVWEKVFPAYVDYRTLSTFATVNMQKQRLKVFIKMGDRDIDDPRGLTEPIPESWGYGHLNTQFVISDPTEIDYAMSLIRQAHEYVSG